MAATVVALAHILLYFEPNGAYNRLKKRFFNKIGCELNMYEIDILSRITENISQFSRAEQKAAQVILDDIMFSVRASISELAKRAKVSEATITRLAKSLGCKNVRDLKVQLAQAAMVGERYLREVNVEPSGISGVYEAAIKILNQNAKLIDQEKLDLCVSRFAEARQVLIFGVGGASTLMAQECQFRLFRIGISAAAYSDPMLMRMVSSTVDKNDIVMCLSVGGFSPDVQESAEIARQFGATIVAITSKNNQLADNADIHLPIYFQEGEYIFKPSASRYAMLAAIDVLTTELAVKTKRRSREKLRRLKRTLDIYRDGNDNLPLGD